MPIEIKELVIRTVVGRDAGVDASPFGQGDSDDPSPAAKGATLDEIVQACVRETLRVLRQRRER